MLKIGVLVSGGGTNLQAIIDAIDNGIIKNAEIVCVISSKADAYALTRAQKRGIKTAVIQKKNYNGIEEFDNALISFLEKEKTELIVLAGYLTILSERFTKHFSNRIINVHPSLIPSFCGDGCFGLKVHEAALEYGVKVTGATVHFVNEITDGGKIILQKAVEVLEGDTPKILQKRVMEQAEWDILPRAIDLIASGKIKIG
jgi:phosphoribosylglycinamide formyltransferase-1